MYYACFYAASALLIANEIQVKSHEGVRQQLGLHFVLTGKIPQEQGDFY
ncbi:MAG: HEPN domain-containing protein, partial [Bacteroidales bacterium]|nr:HEPN domain-containing protein [Bacteroidales bacterium]